jgi:hypothetical protein
MNRENSVMKTNNKQTETNTGSQSVVRRRVHRWLTAAGVSAGCLTQSATAAQAAGIDFLDPSAVRLANREAVEAALRTSHSGFIRISTIEISPVQSPNGIAAPYDSSRRQLVGAPPAGSPARAGEQSGNGQFTNDASQPADQAARSVGSTRVE